VVIMQLWLDRYSHNCMITEEEVGEGGTQR
jgi:hypothetical protein